MTDYEALVREYAALTADIQPALDRIEEIKDELRDLPLGKHELANLTVQLTSNNRLDKRAFEDRYPVTDFPDFYKRDVNTAAIKKALSPREIEELSTPGTPRLTIK